MRAWSAWRAKMKRPHPGGKAGSSRSRIISTRPPTEARFVFSAQCATLSRPQARGTAAVRGNTREPLMSFKDLYTLGTEGSTWSVKQDFDAVFNWDYDDGRAAMMGLYAKGKEMQWDATTRIDWSQELDENNPQGMPDESLPVSCAPCFLKMPEKEKGNVRRHFQAWQLSQFMQGEQGALICAAKIVTQVPDVDSKFYAA